MKRKSREINIFSMSALDLFASALGAFILISIVLFPFFPNISDEDLAQEMAELTAQLAEAQFPHLDLVVVMDTTGSMGESIAGLKEDVGTIVEVLLNLVPSLAVGVVAFNDRRQNVVVKTMRLRPVQNGDANFNALKQFVDGLQAVGSEVNKDIPEANYQGLREAIGMPWRSKSQEKIIIMVTDAPPYSDRYNATLQLARQFAGKGKSVSAAWVRSGTQLSRGDPAKAEKFMRELAQAGGGSFSQAGGSITGSVLLALLKARGKSD